LGGSPGSGKGDESRGDFELSVIYGIGQYKIQQYGHDVIEFINDKISENSC
jgi:hypothetical protein